MLLMKKQGHPKPCLTQTKSKTIPQMMHTRPKSMLKESNID